MTPTREEMRRALVQRHGREVQEKLEAATVAVCGLGGLGSHVAPALARAGIGRLILIDFDRVDLSNLHRQQYKTEQLGRFKTEALADNIREIAPYTELVTFTEKMTEKNCGRLLAGANVICEAFDRPEAKAMLVNTVCEQLPGRFLVSASGMAGFGPANTIRTRRLTEHFYLCGDGVSGVEEEEGLVCSRVMLCAAHEAHAVIRIIAEKFEV